jgi:hypothetical protein
LPVLLGVFPGGAHRPHDLIDLVPAVTGVRNAVFDVVLLMLNAREPPVTPTFSEPASRRATSSVTADPDASSSAPLKTTPLVTPR